MQHPEVIRISCRPDSGKGRMHLRLLAGNPEVDTLIIFVGDSTMSTIVVNPMGLSIIQQYAPVVTSGLPGAKGEFYQ